MPPPCIPSRWRRISTLSAIFARFLYLLTALCAQRHCFPVLGDEAPGIRPGRGIHARQLVEAGRRNSPRLGQAPKPPALLPTRRGTRRWRSDFRGESVGGYALRFDLPPGYKKNGRLLSLRRARRRLRRGGRTRQLRVLNAEDGPEATPQLFRQRVQINRTLAWRVARAGLVRGARRAGGGAIEPKLNVGEWEPPTLLL